MPRKRARNPLKRKQVDQDLAPNEFVNRRKDKKAKTKFDNEVEGGAAPRGWTQMMNRLNKQKEKTVPSKKQKQIEKSRGRTSESSNKGKGSVSGSTPEEEGPSKKAELKIQPGEKMGDFVRRVDKELPLVKARSGSPSRAAKKKQKQKEKEERLAKERRRAKGIDTDEELEQEEEERLKRSKREPSPDPFAVLESKKERPKFNEVADRPPELGITQRMLNSVPKASGSLARRTILAEERQRVIDEYRRVNNKPLVEED